MRLRVFYAKPHFCVLKTPWSYFSLWLLITPISYKIYDVHNIIFIGKPCSSNHFIVEADEWLYAGEKNEPEYDERSILKLARLIDVTLVVFSAYKNTEALVRHLEQRKIKFLQVNQSEQKEINRSATESQSRKRLIKVLKLK